MTPDPQPQEHCLCEGVCPSYIISQDELKPKYRGSPCSDNFRTKNCKHDTRSRPTPSPIQSCKYIAGELCIVCDDSTCKFYPLHNHDASIAAQAREEVLDDVIEQLGDLNRYACEEYGEASLSDNEREMRLHLEYGNRLWGIIRSLRTEAPK